MSGMRGVLTQKQMAVPDKLCKCGIDKFADVIYAWCPAGSLVSAFLHNFLAGSFPRDIIGENLSSFVMI